MMEIDRKKYAVAFMQLNVILGNLSDEERQKIPSQFLKEIKKYKSNTYKYKYDYSKPLVEQDMLPLTRDLLAYIYAKFLRKDVLNKGDVNEDVGKLFGENASEG